MARGYNKLIAIGNLGKDPETRFLPSGAQVTSFSIACTESWKDKTTGETKERTEWINCECWGKLAEICAQYLTKGSQVFVEGKMRTESWEKDGITRYATKIRMDGVQFLGSKPQGSGTTTSAPVPKTDTPAQPDFDDDIPF
jgi:single-strand DNA-binding protein